MTRAAAVSIFMFVSVAGLLNAQEAQYGVAVPLTISGGFMDTERALAEDPRAPRDFAGFRLLAMPELKLGSHWYGYGALQLRSTPYFYQDAYDSDRTVDFDVIQCFAGYSQNWEHSAFGFKIGKIASAFGYFPPRYDDAVNPLLDQPLAYNYLLLYPGPGSGAYGLTPVTIYGLPAAEADYSWHRIDTRFQFTMSNPYNPRAFYQSGQHPQWTAGGGYTIRQGFRVGVSAYSGPWLAGPTAAFIPPGGNATNYPASAFGFDAQFARGRWSTAGEWDRFYFSFPGLSNTATLSFGYVEGKMIVTPRWYVAVRANYQTDNHAIFDGVTSPTTVFPNRGYYEAAVGFRPDRFQLLKVGYEWAHIENGVVNHDNVLGIQFVTSINGISKAIQ
jgi:hypothetical protein